MKIPALILALSLCAATQEHKLGVAKYVIPPYPAIAKQARLMGPVILDLQLASDGSVKEATVFSGHPVLKEAALDAAKQWRFVCLDCKPGDPFRHRLEIRFVLTDDCGEDSWRALLDLPRRLTVETTAGCITISSH